MPAPFLAPALPKEAAPAAAPIPSADETSPISFLIKGITDLANRTGGRRLAQQPPQQQVGPLFGCLNDFGAPFHTDPPFNLNPCCVWGTSL